jgi:hypothetical protein
LLREPGRRNFDVSEITDTACSRNSLDYEGLKVLAKDLGQPLHALVALAKQNDPFCAGMPSRKAQGEWFAGVWARGGFRPGIHLRGVHYWLVSQREPVLLPNGRRYENTHESWVALVPAARDARHLGLVPVDRWTDRKSSSIVHLVEPTAASITVEHAYDYNWDVRDIPALPRLELARPTIAQPYHVELWCEKTTINDLLISLARQYGLNVVTGEGEISLTQCHEVVDRAVQAGLPTRILYISDFDPAGQSMPVAVARKIEHAIYRRQLDLDIQVRNVALTKEQIIEFDIPSIPLKETELRAPDFRERHGDLAAELDALEVLHPGALRRILVKEIERYCDPDLDDATNDAAAELEQVLESVTDEVHEEHRAAIDELTAGWAEIATATETWKERAGIP